MRGQRYKKGMYVSSKAKYVIHYFKAWACFSRSGPGDLVFFNTMRHAFSHVGIYIGNGKFIHSPKPGAEVRVEDMGLAYWARRFDGARRVSAEASPAKSP